MKQITRNQIGRPVGKTVLLSITAGLGIILLGAVITAALVSNGTLDESSIQTVSMLILAIGAFATAIISTGGQSGNFALQMTAACGIVYLVLVGMNIMLFDGAFPRIAACTLVFALGVALAVADKIIRGKTGSRGRFKYRFR